MRPKAALLATALSLACSSQSFDGRVYHGDEITFRVGPVPGNWREIEVDGTLLAFRDDSTSATVAVSGRCGLDGDDVPLTALTHHLFLQFTEREVMSQKVVALDGREALRSELMAKLDGVPKHYVVYVLKKDGCVYDFMRIAPDQSDLATFERFVQGFATMS
jgi:hypothetical protein